MSAPPSTRLAPTPSGALHAGNAFSFLCAWLWARSCKGSVLLRIEDTDLARAKPAWVESIFRDLDWLGLDWDRGPQGPSDTQSLNRQSAPLRQERYRAIWGDWVWRGLLYPCKCTRSDLRTDAPQFERIGEVDSTAPAYAGRCRDRRVQDAGPADAWRLRLPEHPSEWADLWRGPQRLPRLELLGDPVLRRGDGIFAYHLAVCADDADQGIDLVVRGRDLLSFGHLHRHLHSLLGTRPPEFAHHPLLGTLDGARLAKRIGSSSLSSMRQNGIDPRLVVGRLAPLLYPDAGLDGSPVPLSDLVVLGVPRPGISDQTCPALLEGIS